MLRQLELFHSFVRRWKETIGSDILVLSSIGEPLASSDGVPPFDWHKILEKASLHRTTVISHADQILVAAPLLREQKNFGYLLALNAGKNQAALLAWLAETMTNRMVDDEALAGMTDELIGAWDQLDLIYKVTQNLSLTSDLMAALRTILQEIRKVVNTEDGFILLHRGQSLEIVTCLSAETGPAYDATLLENLARAEHLVLNHTLAECRQIWPDAPDQIKNMLATSLPGLDEGARAALGLINKFDSDFSAGDVKLLGALAQQVGTIIKNFLIHEKLIIEERLSRELEIAAEIQESLLPTDLPKVRDLEMTVASIPASEVGGDFYDFVAIDDHKLTLVMGDVAGKGIPAAMLTSVTRTMLRVEAMRGESPKAIIQRANNVLHQDLSRADSFVTVFVATIDTEKQTLDYASAGHAPVLLWRAISRTTEQLRATFPPIGIFGYQGESPRTIPLHPGDMLMLYTDGITEAQSPNGELFGLNRLIYILESKADESPETVREYIQSEITNFRKNAPGGDDATLLIVKILPHSEVVTPRDFSTVIDTIDFSYPADVKYLNEISELVTVACRKLPALPHGFKGDDFIYLVELAISEICTNIIKHAYAELEGKVDGRITLLDNGVQLDLYDTGASFDPNTIPPPQADLSRLKEGGYGLHIVRQIMDVVSYEHYPKRGNHWYLLKWLPKSSV